VLSTGSRSLVFVRAADGTLMPREVTAGRTVGRSVEIMAGLEAGERVVSSAAFLVDAESNLGALTAGMDTTDAGDGMDHDMDAVEGTDDMDDMEDGHDGHAPAGTPAPSAASNRR
jgi:Cu(I)/Ag(I) efflux system membrane fusion protein